MKKTLYSIIIAAGLLLSPLSFATSGIGHEQGYHQGCDHDKDDKDHHPKPPKDYGHSDPKPTKPPKYDDDNHGGVKPPKPPKDYHDHPKPVPTPAPGPKPSPSPTPGNGASPINSVTTSNLTGTNSNTNSSTSTSSLANSGNSNVTVNTGNQGSGEGNKTIFVQSHAVAPVQASQIAAGSIIKDSSICGPLQQVVTTPITGTKFGWFSDTQVFLGYQYTLAPYYDKDGNQRSFKYVDGQKIGHQVIMFNTVLGVSGSSGVSIGGNGVGGNGGSGSASGSSAMQEQATQIQLRECLLEETKVVQSPPQVQVIKETVYIQSEPVKKAVKKKTKKAPLPDCRTICSN